MQRHPYWYRHNSGRDGSLAARSSSRNSMVAVPHKEDFPDLEDVYRRQFYPGLQLPYSGPSIWIDVAPRKKGPVKVAVSTNATDDPVQGDLLQAGILSRLAEA